jgi:hypothetical protein
MRFKILLSFEGRLERIKAIQYKHGVFMYRFEIYCFNVLTLSREAVLLSVRCFL